MQRQIFNSDRGLFGSAASRLGALLAMTGLLLLAGCEGRGNPATKNNLADDFARDGVPPVLTSVTIQNTRASGPKANGTAKLGQIVRIEIVASESIKAPLVTIMGVEADVDGNANEWSATRAFTEDDVDGESEAGSCWPAPTVARCSTVPRAARMPAADPWRATGGWMARVPSALVRPRSTRSGLITPQRLTRASTFGPAGLTMSIALAVTAHSRISREMTPGLKRGKAVAMPVRRR